MSDAKHPPFRIDRIAVHMDKATPRFESTGLGRVVTGLVFAAALAGFIAGVAAIHMVAR